MRLFHLSGVHCLVFVTPLAVLQVSAIAAQPGSTAQVPQGLTSSGSGQDRVLWRFRLNSYLPIQHVAVGSDGVIYASDNDATYAINPDGSPRWVSQAAGSKDGSGGRAISFGEDGTIYTGIAIIDDAYAPVVALNPDGSTRWVFQSGTPGSTLIAGPNVGPDGNIYAVEEADNGGLGAFALDPDGNLLWSNPGDPLLDHALPPDTITQVEFGADRLHFGVVFFRSGNNPVVYTFSLGGAQLWTTWNLNPHVTTHPVVDPFNRVIVSSGQTGLQALEPDRVRQWLTSHPNGISVVRRPAVDAQGVLYSGDFIGVDLWSLNPDGTVRWVRPPEPETTLGELGITPNGEVLVASGTSEVAGWVRGFSPENGTPLWQVDLLPENGMFQFVSSREPAFSPDSQVAYVTTQFAGDINDFGYVVAIRVGPEEQAVLPGDMNCDGLVSASDIAFFVLALTDPGTYVVQMPDCNALLADFNGDESISVEDIAGFVAALVDS